MQARCFGVVPAEGRESGPRWCLKMWAIDRNLPGIRRSFHKLLKHVPLQAYIGVNAAKEMKARPRR